MDTKILESRLITRESTLQGSSVTKCASRLQQLFHFVSKGDYDIARSVQETLIREIMLYKFEITKYDQCRNVCDQEIAEYAVSGQEIENRIKTTQESIEALTEELKQQKILRHHKEECEMMARIVNGVPTRTKAMNEIMAIENAIKNVKDHLISKENHEKLRLKQVGLLMQAIADLQNSFEEDSLLSLAQQQMDSTMQGMDDEERDNVDDEVDERDEESSRANRGRSQVKKQRTDGDVDMSAGNEDGMSGTETEGVVNDMVAGGATSSENVDENSMAIDIPSQQFAETSENTGEKSNSIGQSSIFLKPLSNSNNKSSEPEEGEEAEDDNSSAMTF
jgi:hypothetical protein